MSRKTESASTPAASAKLANQMKSLREKIDKLDQQILTLVNQRAGFAGEIGKLKNETNAEPFAPAREEEVLKQVLEMNKGPLDNDTVRAIYREIISGSDDARSLTFEFGKGGRVPGSSSSFRWLKIKA